MTTKDLGMVTAYAYAVMGGYEGTEAEFEALLGNIATDLEEIENLTVVANTLPEGSSATASYADGVLTLGIPKGDTGATGAGATATAGTTTTGNPGTNASVTNSGTAKDAVFNFTIPRGDTGNGIESIYLTGTSGAVKTYTILFTDGNTTTFDVTDGEVTNATLATILEDYAKVDGAYEQMTVGNAEQLISSVTVNDKVPYNFRTSGGSIDIGNREVDKLVGGTVAWNQMSPTFSTENWEGENQSSASISETTINVTFSTGAPQVYLPAVRPKSLMSFTEGHKYLCSLKFKSTKAGYPYYRNDAFGNSFPLGTSVAEANVWKTYATVARATNTVKYRGYFGQGNANSAGLTYDDVISFKDIVLFDLTQMFGSTIADYIYSLETANAGAGVAWFKKLFPKDYYAYNAGELMSVKTSAHEMVGFNAWDEEWELGSLDTDTGAPTTSDSTIRSKNFIPCVPGTTYYAKTAGVAMPLFFYDANKNYLSKVTKTNNTFTTPADAHFIKFRMASDYGTTYKNDLCINLSWDGERDGDYEAYKKWTYPLDSDLELRGIPKLDASNNLYYDGDTYEDDGTVNRRFGIVDLGTLDWGASSSANCFYSALSNAGYVYASGNDVGILCAKYINGGARSSSPYYGNDKELTYYTHTESQTTSEIYIHDSAYSDATTFKTAMNGVYLVYELSTPTTEEADPYQNPQIVDDFGTEEYVDERTVAIPVGHDTEYMNNLKAKLEMAPDSPDGDGDYIVRQTNGENSYVPLMKELPSLPATDGTYTLKCTVASGTATLGWIEEE